MSSVVDEKQILEKAATALETSTGVQIKRRKDSDRPGRQSDVPIALRIPNEAQLRNYWAEVKKQIFFNNSIIAETAFQAEQSTGKEPNYRIRLEAAS